MTRREHGAVIAVSLLGLLAGWVLAQPAATRPAATQPVATQSARPAAGAPAGPMLSIQQRGKAIYDALDATPLNTAGLKAALRDVGHVSASYHGKSLKKWVDGAAVVEGQIVQTAQVDLNRDTRGEAPDDWIEKLTAPVKAGLSLNLIKLAVAPALQVRAQRDELLGQIDAKVRAGLLELAKTYPALGKTNWGTLEEALEGKSPPGRIEIWAGHYEGNDGTSEKVPADEAYNVLVVLRPLQWPEAPGQWSLKQLYGNLALLGQVHASARDAKLDAAMKFLISDALAALQKLDQAAESGEVAAPASKPAPATP